MNAGFDGVQIQANYLYLIAQFLNSATNRRTDEYGGSTENRARLLFEVTEEVLRHVDANRVGIKIGPMHLTGRSPRIPTPSRAWNMSSAG
jgi:N-ethylmaleimide reductase